MLHVITRLTEHRKRFVITRLSTKLKSLSPIMRTDAAFALGKTRLPEAIPILLAALTDANMWVRYEAVGALRNIRRYSIEVVSVLLVMLDDEDPTVRAQAVQAIEGMAHYSDEVVDALLGALKDADITVRTRAIHALGQIKQNDKAYLHVMESLHRALKDTNLSIRSNAFNALVRISPADYEAVNMLFNALTKEPAWSQRYRQQMLKQIGTPTAMAVLSKYRQARRK